MALSRTTIEDALRDLGLQFQSDGTHYVHSTAGRFSPAVNTIISLDEDGSGATLMTTLPGTIAIEKRAVVCQLLNLVHGQNLWNVRFHLDETGRVFSVAKMMLWGKPFNPVQFGDLFFTSLVTTDRLYPCLQAATEESLDAEQAFERFFLRAEENDEPEEEPSGEA